VILLSSQKAMVQTGEVIEFLKSTLCYREIVHRILQRRVIFASASSRNITVTADAIQAEADRLRHEQGLERAVDAINWLSSELVSAEDWEIGIQSQLLSEHLAESLFAREVERLYAERRLDFDQVVLYQIVVPYEQLAHEVFYQIDESEVSFYEAAHLYDIDPARRRRCGFEGVIYRSHLQPQIAPAIFGAAVCQVLEPIKVEQGYALFWVEEFINAELTPSLRQELMRDLFQDWLSNEVNHLLHS
jgi:parvulin-like peptidyl-prolyl isomerase